MSDQLLEVVTDFNKRMDTGFKGVYKRIEECNQAWDDKFQGHSKRLVKTEEYIAVKKAVNGVNKEAEKEKKVTKKVTKDFWMWGIRSIAVAGAIGLLGTFWSLVQIARKLGIE